MLRASTLAAFAVLVGLLVGSLAVPPPVSAASQTLSLSPARGKPGSFFTVSYQYTPPPGGGCYFGAYVTWTPGINPGEVWYLEGINIDGPHDCGRSKVEMVPVLAKLAKPGQHQVCVVPEMGGPPSPLPPKICRTFTIPGAATPKPTPRPTPKPSAKPTPTPTPTPTAVALVSSSPEVTPTSSATPTATDSPTMSSAASSSVASPPPAANDATGSAGIVIGGVVVFGLAAAGMAVLYARRRGLGP